MGSSETYIPGPLTMFSDLEQFEPLTALNPRTLELLNPLNP
jgi:hypothetical protein